MKKKILLISVAFYPLNDIATLRIGQWAKYLDRAGYDVTVLTTTKYKFLGNLTNNVNLSNSIKVVEIDYIPSFLRQLLAMQDNDNTSNKTDKQNRYINNLKRIIRYVRKYIGHMFDIYDLWVNPAYKEGMKLFEENSFEYIISSFSPPATHKIAHKLKRKYPKTQWIADFRDLWADNHFLTARGPFLLISEIQEKLNLLNANKIITVSEIWSQKMQSKYPKKRVFTIENGFDQEQFIDWKVKLKKIPVIKEKINISYLGTIYPQKQDPTMCFIALNELIDEGICTSNQIEINFYGNNEKILLDIIRKNNYNRHNIIKIHGAISTMESFNIQAHADMLLLLDWNDISEKGVLPGKLFEYIISGSPILSLGINNDSSAAKLIKQTMTGIVANNKNSIKKIMIDLFKKKKINFYTPSIEMIEKYSRSGQVDRLIKIIECNDNIGLT